METQWSELQRLLNEWDPIGVYDPVTDFPSDEYDCLYSPLMTRLREGESAAEIGDFLARELRDHFGLNPRHSEPQAFAEKLKAWFADSSN